MADDRISLASGSGFTAGGGHSRRSVGNALTRDATPRSRASAKAVATAMRVAEGCTKLASHSSSRDHGPRLIRAHRWTIRRVSMTRTAMLDGNCDGLRGRLGRSGHHAKRAAAGPPCPNCSVDVPYLYCDEALLVGSLLAAALLARVTLRRGLSGGGSSLPNRLKNEPPLLLPPLLGLLLGPLLATPAKV